MTVTSTLARGRIEQVARVAVTRKGRDWCADVDDTGAAIRTPSLARLDRWIQGLLGHPWPEYEFQTGDVDLDRPVTELGASRRTARRAEEQVQRLTDAVLARTRGLSGRDVSVLVALSHQRVQQLRARY